MHFFLDFVWREYLENSTHFGWTISPKICCYLANSISHIGDSMDIDAHDVQIMGHLASNGRITMTELASLVGLTKTPVQARVKRLEEAGYIKGYRAELDPTVMGLDHVAFVQVTLSNGSVEGQEAFEAAVAQVNEIEQVHLVAGSFDYLLKVRTRNISDFRTVLTEKISNLSCVNSTSSFVAMAAIKEKSF